MLSARAGRDVGDVVQAVLTVTSAVAIPFGEEHWRVALAAWSRFGKSRHRAGLNFGDCLAYATAKVAGEPLLAVGGDFALTDIRLA